MDSFKKFVFLKRGWVGVTWQKSLMRIRAAQKRGLVFEPWNPDAGDSYLMMRLEQGATTFAFNSDVKLLNTWHQYKTGQKERFTPRKPPRSTFKFLTASDVQRVFTYHHPNQEVKRQRKALFFWAIKSGMRVGEIAAMDESHLSEKDSKFLVAKPSKRGKRRWNPIERFVWSPKRPFKAYLEKRPRVATDLGAIWTTRYTGSGRGITGPPRKMTDKALTDALRDMGKSVKLGKPLNFNVTRHTRGTELYRRWRNLLLVKEYLGHASVQSTEVYAAVVDGDLDREMRRRPGRDPFQGADPND